MIQSTTAPNFQAYSVTLSHSSSLNIVILPCIESQHPFFMAVSVKTFPPIAQATLKWNTLHHPPCMVWDFSLSSSYLCWDNVPSWPFSGFPSAGWSDGSGVKSPGDTADRSCPSISGNEPELSFSAVSALNCSLIAPTRSLCFSYTENIFYAMCLRLLFLEILWDHPTFSSISIHTLCVSSKKRNSHWKNRQTEPAVVAHNYNPSTWQEEAGRPPAWSR